MSQGTNLQLEMPVFRLLIIINLTDNQYSKRCSKFCEIAQ